VAEVVPTTRHLDTWRLRLTAFLRHAYNTRAMEQTSPEQQSTPAHKLAGSSPEGSSHPGVVVTSIPVVRRITSARRHALLRRQWRNRVALIFVLLASVLFIGPSQTEWIQAGAAARATWRYDHALSFYHLALLRDPADPRPYCLTGEVRSLQREFRLATDAYWRCRVLGEDTAAVALRLGDLAQAQGDDPTAQREWLRSVSRGGTTARRRLGLWHEARGEFDQAAAQWTALGPRDGQAQEHLGMLALRVQDFAAAQRYLLAARELPGFYGQEAVDAEFVQLAALGPNNPNAATSIGVAFVRADLPGFARLPLESAIAAAPDDATAHAYLAWVELVADQPGAADAQLHVALSLAPLDPFARFVAASRDGERGNWSAAADDCQLALQQDDRNPGVWLLLGRAQEGEQAYFAAELSYERAATLGTEPDYAEQLLAFYIGHRLGLTDGRAFEAAVSAESRWPANATIRKLEGQIDDLLGQYTKAGQSWTAALRLDPTDPEPWFVLGRYAYVGGDLTSAVVYLRTAVALQPGSSWAAQARKLLAPLPGAAL
jgi:tetratricopeptide (TPR) repeat protein